MLSLTSLLLYVVFGVLFIGSLFNPLFGVAGYLSVYCLYDPYIWWGGALSATLVRPSFLAMVFSLAGCILHFKQIQWKMSAQEICMYLFLIFAWLTTLFFPIVPADEITLLYLDKITKMFIFLFIFNRTITTFSRFRFIIWVFLACGAFLAYQAQVALPSQFVDGRLEELGGTDFHEANQLAGFLSIILALISYRLFLPGWIKRAIYVVSIAFILNAIIMTQSRAVFLGMIVAAPFAIFLAPRLYRKHIVLCIVLGGILFFSLSDVRFLTRMDTIQDSFQSSSSDGQVNQPLTRFDFWRAAYGMFSDHPFGVGVKNYEKLIRFYDRRVRSMDAHNTYVLCAAELGIQGISLFILILLQSFLSLWRAIKNAETLPDKTEAKLTACALITALIIMAFGLMTTHSILYTEILWILISLTHILDKVTRPARETVSAIDMSAPALASQ